MNIQNEIVEYLETHDFVLLPGIGGLTANYSLPFIDSKSNIIASKREIKLLPYLDKEADLSFLNSLKDKHQLSLNTVQNTYINFLESFNKTIIEKGSYDWDGLGKFTFDPKNNTYQFIQTDKVPLKVVKKPVSEIEKVKPLAEIAEPAESHISEDSPVDSKEEVNELPSDKLDNFESEEVSEKKPNWLLYLLPLALLFAAFIYTVFFKPISENTVKVEEHMEESSIFEEENKEAEFHEGEEIIVTESNVNIDNEEVVRVPDNAVEHIVRIGYFRNNEEADEVATYLAENGYPSRVRPSGRMFKVFLVAKNENQALQYVEEVKELINDNPIYENQIKGE